MSYTYEELGKMALLSYEHKCNECGKSFLVPCVELYTYKLTIVNKQKLYCCYSCWIRNYRKLSEEKQAKNAAYYQRQREKKSRENARRRERTKNGHA